MIPVDGMEPCFLGDVPMRSFASLLVLGGVFLGVLAGCSGEKKKVEAPSTATPPPPVHNKTKPVPNVQEK